MNITPPTVIARMSVASIRFRPPTSSSAPLRRLKQVEAIRAIRPMATTPSMATPTIPWSPARRSIFMTMPATWSTRPISPAWALPLQQQRVAVGRSLACPTIMTSKSCPTPRSTRSRLKRLPEPIRSSSASSTSRRRFRPMSTCRCRLR